MCQIVKTDRPINERPPPPPTRWHSVVVEAEKPTLRHPQANRAPTQLILTAAADPATYTPPGSARAVVADPATHSNQDLPSLASGSSSRKSDTPSPSAKLRAHSTHPRRRRASPRTPPPIHTQCAVAIILHPAPAPTTRHTHTGRDTITSSRREQ